eukprot:6655361-Prymnesium_polylepis.1
MHVGGNFPPTATHAAVWFLGCDRQGTVFLTGPLTRHRPQVRCVTHTAVCAGIGRLMCVYSTRAVAPPCLLRVPDACPVR